ncbi:tetratricopeptide repeat protein [Xanthomonas sp. PPL568]|uniref:tetratricopeptide repeat protein n=1 Tax=Xanthomonas indica TaxID=2912242 RepID=UPI001F5A6310|nr:tetratricopeptide repeat protein [Xanthomonas indica]MCI2243090.1 tetratricopeptide repeat protein [Xanthomonas indica]
MSASSPNDRLAQAKALAMSAFQDAQRADALLAQAEALLRAVARAVPADADALTCLGAVLCDRGHYRRALTALRRAVRLQSHDRNTYFHLGVALLNAGREAEAMAAFRKAATLHAAPGGRGRRISIRTRTSDAAPVWRGDALTATRPASRRRCLR